MRKVITLFLINLIPFTRFYYFKNLLLKMAGATVGGNVRIGGKIQISNPCNLIIGSNVWLGDSLKIYNSGAGVIHIGNNVDVGPNCVMVTGTHEIGNSTHRAGKGMNYPIVIGNGVWIGASATILGNVTIGSGVIVASGAVVHKSIDENHLVGGVSVKYIKKLNTDE